MARNVRSKEERLAVLEQKINREEKSRTFRVRSSERETSSSNQHANGHGKGKGAWVNPGRDCRETGNRR